MQSQSKARTKPMEEPKIDWSLERQMMKPLVNNLHEVRKEYCEGAMMQKLNFVDKLVFRFVKRFEMNKALEWYFRDKITIVEAEAYFGIRIYQTEYRWEGLSTKNYINSKINMN